MSRVSLVFGALTLSLLGCTSPVTTDEVLPPPEVVQSLSRYRREYVLASGDTIEVLVRGVAELSRGLVVRPDGFVTLPITGDVPAAGRTPSELKQDLVRLLEARVREPEVTVIVTSARPPMIYVFGEVGQPTPVEVRQAATAAQAIAYAGGFRLSANRDAVSIIRLSDQGHLQAIRIPSGLSGQPAHLLALQSMALQADDIVFVPETGISEWNYYVQSFVNQPLSGVNSLLTTWTQFRLSQVLEKSL